MIKTLSIDQSETLISYLQNINYIQGKSHTGIRNYAMTLMMLDAGLRVGELVQLRMTDLWSNDESVKCLEVRPEISKGNRPRYIPMTMRLRTTIAGMYNKVWNQWGIAHGNFAFFVSTPNSQLSTRQIQRIIKRAAQASIGIPIHPHILRHTFATKLMKTSSLRVVQELLGHKSITSTQVYTHVNNQDCIEAIRKLEE